MPGQIKSQKQFKFLQAAAHSRVKGDMPKGTAEKMLKDNPVDYGELPKYKKPKKGPK